MNTYVLSCCSTADLTAEHFAARDIRWLPFHFSLGGKQYDDDLGKSVPFPEFYEAMRRDVMTMTSQPNTDEFVNYFRPFLEAGLDVVHVTLSSGLSGVMTSAIAARDILSEMFPERRIYLVDSLGASSGYGLLMDTMATLRDGGMGAAELAAWADEHRLEMHHWFFSTDLQYYVRGGRIKKSAGWVGTILNICPLMNMDAAGRLVPREKIRTKRRVIEAAADRMASFARGGTDYSGKCYISQSDCWEDARALADLVEARFPHLDGKVEINHVGTTIGSHTGPGTVALFFWGKKRAD